MPKITVDDLDINYQVLGKGQPLLLIIGLSFSLLDWGTEFPELLAQQYQVILFDNRDAGATSPSAKAYTVRQMAEDSVGLLTALGIDKAHVLGVSMGGMIAQNMALNYPDKIEKLVLGCTAAGGACSKFGSFNDLLSTNAASLLFPSSFIKSNQSSLFTFLRETMPYRSQGEALNRQLQALGTHDTCNLLSHISMPTLVITGDEDKAVLPENSVFLANSIPGATLKIIEGAGHGFCFSHAASAAAEILSFL